MDSMRGPSISSCKREARGLEDRGGEFPLDLSNTTGVNKI